MVAVAFFEVVAMIAVVTLPQLLDVAWCGAVVIVVVACCSAISVVYWSVA